MEALRQTQKKYCSRAITTAIFAGFFCIILGQEPVGKGLILGTIFSIVNFILMGETLPMKLGKSKGKAALASLGSIFVRYIILAVPLIIGIKYEQYNIFAVIVGIFFIQIVILAEQALILFSSAREKQL